MATILHIEDDQSIRQLIQLLFENRDDLTVLEAETGKEGFSLAQTAKPDVILMDITLPDMSGGEVLELLRKNDSTVTIPVIAISGNSAHNTRTQFPGFDDYLDKPIDFKSLQDSIESFMK